MTVAELLVRLHQMGVKVEPQDGRLRLRAPAGTLSEALRAEVASQRDEILAFLTARSAARVDEPALERVARDPDLPLSFAQQRLWFLDRLAPGNAFYNQPLAWRLRGPVDFSAVQRALHLIVSQHEVLRTRFPLRQASPVQVVETRPHPDMARIDLRRLAATERWAEARRQMGTETRRPFDLAQGPMIRSLWIQLADDDTAWNLTLHHIVIDGWSIEVLQRQLATFYDALRADRPVSMPELPFQYADFSVWQRRWLVGERLERQLAYWRQQLTGVQDLELPTDRPRPAVQSFRGRSQRFHWPEALATDLERLSRGHATTLYITLLAAFEAWLHRLTGQADVTVGAPIANRDRPELEELIGCFANIQVQRSRITGDPCFEQ
ncbi:MAG: condensation domain-containing protein, partial [Acidobacteriota bacterium]